MRCDPSSDVNSDCRNFSASRMYAGQTIDAKAFDIKVSHGPNQDLFEVAHVTMNVFAVGTEIDDWITDHLAQTVIRHLPTAIRFEQRHVSGAELFGVEQD